ncbi:7029_t:CDS:2 [Cetraspora pellucida]|uniref:7029_t:CDS:1 n=1 Tax=Cetraspora pellucida TaxID=1433469 RepID=A0ACA9LIY7_9GLOM|nr:7029_t:CDS:2 [Cetraspora pellucida]
MKSKRLTEAEKAEVRKELEGVDMKMDEILQGQNLSELAKTNPTFISEFYQHFYEQGKALVRAKTKASSISRSTEELKRQQKFQAIWDISKTEEKAITEQLKKDEKETQKEEGKTTLGITYYYFVGDDNEEGGETSFLTYGKVDDIKPIRIRLKKEMFLNRLGYEEFITKLNEKGGFSYVDICFESVVDTIAHELAHAIVATFEFKYEGKEGGGHGKLFYDICKEIEVMIREDPKFEEFEK